MPIAVFPGTYDPITRGHEDLIVRGLHFAERVIVAVAAQGGFMVRMPRPCVPGGNFSR